MCTKLAGPKLQQDGLSAPQSSSSSQYHEVLHANADVAKTAERSLHSRPDAYESREDCTYFMLLETVECVQQLLAMVRRHERLLVMKSLKSCLFECWKSFGRGDKYNRSSSDFRTVRTDDSLRKVRSIRVKTLKLKLRRPLPPSVSLSLSAAASVSGLMLVYALFLR